MATLSMTPELDSSTSHETFSRNDNGVRAINGSPASTPTPLAVGLNVKMSHSSPREGTSRRRGLRGVVGDGADQFGGALADEVGDRRVGGDGLEDALLGQTFVEQEPDQAEHLLFSSQFRRPRPRVPHLN